MYSFFSQDKATCAAKAPISGDLTTGLPASCAEVLIRISSAYVWMFLAARSRRAVRQPAPNSSHDQLPETQVIKNLEGEMNTQSKLNTGIEQFKIFALLSFAAFLGFFVAHYLGQ